MKPKKFTNKRKKTSDNGDPLHFLNRVKIEPWRLDSTRFNAAGYSEVGGLGVDEEIWYIICALSGTCQALDANSRVKDFSSTGGGDVE